MGEYTIEEVRVKLTLYTAGNLCDSDTDVYLCRVYESCVLSGRVLGCYRNLVCC